MASNADEPSKLHRRLFKDIADELTADDLVQLKMTAKGHHRVKTGKLAPLNTVFEVLDYLDKAGAIAIGNYKYLKELLDDFPRLVEKVEDAERRLGVMGVHMTEHAEDDSPTPSKRVKPNSNKYSNSPSSVQPDLCDDPRYDCPAGSRGVLVIFNQFTEQREGTEEDEEYIKQFFQGELNYQVLPTLRNLSKQKFLTELQNVAKFIQMHPDATVSLVVVVLSHGNEEGIMTCKSPSEEETDQVLTVKELTQSFKGDELERLRDKPKLFIIQACRGTVGQDGGIRTDDQCQIEDLREDVSQLSVSMTTPHDADMLTAFSTTDGYKSYRHRHEGSFFVHILVDTFKSCYGEEHVVDMLTRVNGKIANQTFPGGKKQMSCFFSTLRKKFYLK